jgi:hypothetical protein
MRCAVLTALVLFMGCAKVAPPPGGPPDNTPPSVVWTVPRSDSVSVGLGTSIRIGFGERMDRRTVERALFVSPRFSVPPEYRWRGQELEIRSREELRPDRTYLVTVGAESSDESWNRMASSYSFAFATGSQINRGEITGGVAPGRERPQGQAYVWAYDLEGEATPDPANDAADYVTQPGENGSYSFPRLGPGRYRIFAFEDRNRDLGYTAETDPISVPPADVDLAEGADRIRLGRLRMALRDTVPPSLLSARTPDDRHILLRFDEPVRLPATVAVRDASSLLPVLAITAEPGDSSRVWLLTQPQEGGASYRLALSGITDMSGNPIPADAEVEIKGEGQPDRRSPEAKSFAPPLDAEYVDPHTALTFVFSEAMGPRIPDGFWAVTDSTDAPEGEFTWPSPNRLSFEPRTPWVPGELRRLTARLDLLSDVAGNHPPRVASLRFTAAAPGDLGEITGLVAPAGSTAVVELLGPMPEETLRRSGLVAGDTAYVFAGLVPGTYIITGFLDVDGNGVWTPGHPLPFLASEPLAEVPDTVEVRPRWASASVRVLSFQPLRSAVRVEEEP